MSVTIRYDLYIRPASSPFCTFFWFSLVYLSLGLIFGFNALTEHSVQYSVVCLEPMLFTRSVGPSVRPSTFIRKYTIYAVCPFFVVGIPRGQRGKLKLGVCRRVSPKEGRQKLVILRFHSYLSLFPFVQFLKTYETIISNVGSFYLYAETDYRIPCNTEYRDHQTRV